MLPAPCWETALRGFIRRGATGHGVLTFLQFVEQFGGR